MMKLFLTLLFFVAPSAFAADVIPANRKPYTGSWEGLAGVSGGIPVRSTVYQTLTTANTRAEINSAIASCPNGQVVQLAAGVYTFSGSIEVRNSDITVRGAGSGIGGRSTTSLTIGTGSKTWTTQSNCQFGVGQTVRCQSATSSAYMQGTITGYSGTSLTVNVTSTSGSGTIADWRITRTDWTTLIFTGATGSGDVTIAGTDFADYNTSDPPVIKNITSGLSQGSTALTLNSVTSLSVGDLVGLDQTEDLVYVNADGNDGYTTYAGRQSGTRSQLQFVTITAINGNVVTISPGLYMPNWTTDESPQLWKTGGEIKNTGVEDLVVFNHTGAAQFSYSFYNAYNCWIKNCAGWDSEVAQVKTYIASRIEVRHCYFDGTLGGAAQSYGIAFYWASDCLAEDNIFQHITGPINFGSTDQGCVAAYNYATEHDYFNPNWQIASFHHHAGHTAYGLVEGNYFNSFYLDRIHGSSSHMTAFRNRLTGREPGRTLNTIAVCLQGWNRYANVIANILGTSGYHDRYEWATPDSVGSDTAVYQIGYASTQGSYPGSGDQAYDSTTYTTSLRKGNYNTVSAAIPSSPVNETMGSDTYPSSYLYSSKPSYFGVLAWPPYDPTSPGAASVDDIPAGYRFLNGSDPPAGGGSSISTLNVTNLTITGP